MPSSQRTIAAVLLASVMLFVAVTASSWAADRETPLEFNRHIRPILAENCFACHGIDAIAREGQLRLDQRQAAIEAGAITAGDADASELVSRIFVDDADTIMPPPETHKSLTYEEKATLKRWINEGAAYQPHWSLIAPQKTRPPTIRKTAWRNNVIDYFVLAKLEELSLTPAREASPRILFRRLHLDITGLPPAPADVTAFTSDYQTRGHEALSAWIDRLMQTTAWGEHRARYWLDAARYGDTHGLHFDNYREIWPYRDWVIRAFNANQPFDQFVVEQLAGDLLENPSQDQLIATGFQRCCMTTNEGGTIAEENLAIYAADRVQTFGWVFLGLTTNCCQCHDHKFDPLTIKDYYSLAAFFRNTTQPALDGNEKRGGGPTILLASEADKPRYEAIPVEIAALETELNERRAAAREDFEAWFTNAAEHIVEDQQKIESLVVHHPLNSPQHILSQAGRGQSADGGQVRVDAPPTDLATASENSANATPPPPVVNGQLEWTEDGLLGPAAKLTSSGTFDLGDVGDFALDQPFSFGAWIKPPNTTQSGGIIARMDNEHGHRGWDLYGTGTSYAVHIIDDWPDNALKVFVTGNPVQPGQWQHLFVTWDGSGKIEGITMYLNGKRKDTHIEKNTLQHGAVINTDVPLRIGRRHSGSYYQNGVVQDFRLYDRTLKPDEVKVISYSGPLSTLQGETDELTEKQRQQLYEYYLSNHDDQFIVLTNTVRAKQDELEMIVKRSPVTLIQEERADAPARAHILMRGAYDEPGDEVAAATPAALPPMPESVPRNRLGLARWVVDPANPLTARVTVNRFWQELFGKGLVVTPEDFGVMGANPTHPELLDWLAVEFQQSGWDVKRLFKLMLMSATYRQAATVNADKLEQDRDNDFFSRGPRFRMDAEMIRDYALSVSGLLSRKMYGPPVRPYQPDNIWDIVGLPGGDTREYKQDQGESLFRRSLYTFWKRMAPPPGLESFNAPSREVCTVRRERTNTPLQALVTLNDPQYVEAARHLAERLLLETHDTDEQILDRAARLVICRPFTPTELTIVQQSKSRLASFYQEHQDAAEALIAVGDNPSSDELEAATLATWTMICNQLLNLDETLTK